MAAVGMAGRPVVGDGTALVAAQGTAGLLIEEPADSDTGLDTPERQAESKIEVGTPVRPAGADANMQQADRDGRARPAGADTGLPQPERDSHEMVTAMGTAASPAGPDKPFQRTAPGTYAPRAA
jgi:hypothetical protein